MDNSLNNGSFRYIMKTNLSDDFKRLKPTPLPEIDYSWEVDNCPICLMSRGPWLVHKHTFCRVCLQYTIDRMPPDTFDERGFDCVVCGYFTKVVNYSVPRDEWACYEPEDYRFLKSVEDSNIGKLQTDKKHKVNLIIPILTLGRDPDYNQTMTLVFSFKEKDVFDHSVLGSVLYMTIPEEKCIHVYDLLERVRKDPLYLTMKCYGIDTFNDTLTVLLCEGNVMKYEVCVLKSIGIVSEIIALKGGKLTFKCPRELAMCDRTRLIYVSDEEACIVKCFRFDRHLSWERLVYGAGSLAVYNSYLMVGREYTSSIDVVIGGGKFNGRLQSYKFCFG